jgi:hypothetical protein
MEEQKCRIPYIALLAHILTCLLIYFHQIIWRLKDFFFTYEAQYFQRKKTNESSTKTEIKIWHNREFLCKVWGFHSRDYEECHLQPPGHTGSSLADFPTLKMEAILSSETSVNTRPTQRHIPEDDILQRICVLHRQCSVVLLVNLRGCNWIVVVLSL